jgi:hypothetical protein
MIVIKKFRNILALLTLAIGLAGCNMRISPEELLQPPKLFDEDEKISSMIEESLPEDAKLENINSEEGLSAVKKSDVNGDGIEEIMVFYSKEDESSLHMAVFEESGGAYESSVEVEVPGRFFEEMLLDDITGDGLKEIVVNTSEKRAQSGSYRMNIYSYKKDPSKFFEIDYSKYLLYDLDKNGKSDIVILNQEEKAVSVDYYSYNEKSEQMEFVNETLLDKRDVLDMAAIETDGGSTKVLLEFESRTEEKERVFLSLDRQGKLESEEE